VGGGGSERLSHVSSFTDPFAGGACKGATRARSNSAAVGAVGPVFSGEQVEARLLAVRGNHLCADCTTSAPNCPPRPAWASTNIGTLICIRCAGVHRKLGSHVSKVLSIKIDNWSMAQLELMEARGNERVNAELEAWLAPGVKPDLSECTPEYHEGYIRAKYELGSFRVGGDGRIPTVSGANSELQHGMTEFSGLLIVKLIRCSHLPNMDTFSKTDAFCAFYLGDQKCKSKTCKNNLNPHFGETLSLNAKSPDDVLLIKVFDEDIFRSPTEIGQAQLSLSELTHDGQPMGFDLTLQLLKPRVMPHNPSVAVELTYNPLS